MPGPRRPEFRQAAAGPTLDELPDPWVGGSVEVGHAAVEHDLRLARLQPEGGVEHDHAVGDLAGGVHVVRDDHAGDAGPPPHFEDQLVDHVGHDRIEAGGRLVVEHEQRVEGEGPGEAGPLPHAARELDRLLGEHGSRQPDLVDERLHDAADLRLGQPGVLAERKGDVVEDRQAVEQRGALEDEPVAGAEVGQGAVVERRQ
jgi:hypothetical protein